MREQSNGLRGGDIISNLFNSFHHWREKEMNLDWSGLIIWMCFAFLQYSFGHYCGYKEGEAVYLDENGQRLLPEFPGYVRPLLDDLIADDWEIKP
jgi:hypothetical protein